MKTTIEVSRDSIKMTIMAISDAVPEKARGIVLQMIQGRLEAFLAKCPDKTFRLTLETYDDPKG